MFSAIQVREGRNQREKLMWTTQSKKLFSFFGPTESRSNCFGGEAQHKICWICGSSWLQAERTLANPCRNVPQGYGCNPASACFMHLNTVVFPARCADAVRPFGQNGRAEMFNIWQVDIPITLKSTQIVTFIKNVVSPEFLVDKMAIFFLKSTCPKIFCNGPCWPCDFFFWKVEITVVCLVPGQSWRNPRERPPQETDN